MAKKNTSSVPKMPGMPSAYNWNIYGGTINAMKNLYSQYSNARFNYKPGQFQYADFGGTDKYETQAQKRTQAQLAAKRVATNTNIGMANNQYNLAAQQTAANEQQGAQAINRQAELDAGRMTNMLANSGVAGQGAATEMYGLRGVASQQIADNAVKYGLEMAQAAAARAGAVTGAESEYQMAQAQSVADQQALEDQLIQQAQAGYLQGRGQAFSEYGDYQNRAYQAASDQYQSYVNGLNSQLGVLGQMASLQGQTSQNIYQDIWNRYNAGYTRYQDVRDFLEGKSRFSATMSAQQRADQMANAQYMAQLKQQGILNQQQYTMTMAQLGLNPDGTPKNTPGSSSGQPWSGSADNTPFDPYVNNGGNFLQNPQYPIFGW